MSNVRTERYQLFVFVFQNRYSVDCPLQHKQGDCQVCFDRFFSMYIITTKKKMKTEGRSPNVFIVFECLQSPDETRQASV